MAGYGNGGLQLNIPGAHADISALQTERAAIADTTGQLKSTAMKLYAGVLVGSGANAGNDFSMMIDTGVNSCNDVIDACTRVVNQSSDDTIGFDQCQFPAAFK